MKTLTLKRQGILKFVSVLFAIGLTVSSFSTASPATASPATASPAEEARSHGVFFEAQDLGPDIPPIGSSYFDKLFYDQAKGSYSMPRTIPGLIEEIERKTGGSVSTSPFFFSRSLQRPVDLSFNPLKHPRFVFSNSRGVGKGQLFIGFLAPKDQIEVISYNSEMGRYEFQIVSTLSSSPAVTYAVRAKCMVCHQNQGPIFPVNPWGDTFSIDGTSFKPAALKLLRGDEQYRKIVDRLGFTGSDFGNIDNDVRAAEGQILFQRLWVHGCNQSRECRFHILSRELGLGEFLPEIMGGYSMEKLLNRSNLRVLKSASSKISGLPTLDPFVYQALLKLHPELNNSATDASISTAVQKMIENPVSQMEIIGLLKNLPVHDSPSTSRATSLIEQYHSLFSTMTASGSGAQISDFFNEGSVFGRALYSVVSAKEVAERLKRLYLSKAIIFEKRPLNLDELINLIANSREKTKIRGLLQLPPSVRPRDFKLSESPIPTFFSVEPLNKLIRHCGQCHQGGGNFPPQFLVGSEETVLDLVLQWKNKISKKIESRAMPPSKSLDEEFDKSGDRQKVLDWLKAM